MKKLTTLLAIFAIAGLGLTSCDQSGTDEIVYPSFEKVTLEERTDGTFFGRFDVTCAQTSSLKEVTASYTYGSTTISIPDQDLDITKGKNYEWTVKLTVPVEAEGTRVSKITLSATVKGSNGGTKSQSFDTPAKDDPTPEEPGETDLSAAAAFSFKRVGGQAATGDLSKFGLKWPENVLAATNVSLQKDGASKFVELAAADWSNITTQEALKEAIDKASDMKAYTGISADKGQDYDVVLGVINEDVLLHAPHHQGYGSDRCHRRYDDRDYRPVQALNGSTVSNKGGNSGLFPPFPYTAFTAPRRPTDRQLPTLFRIAEATELAVGIPPVVAHLHVKLQEHLLAEKLFEFDACGRPHPFQHLALMSDEDAFLRLASHINGSRNAVKTGLLPILVYRYLHTVRNLLLVVEEYLLTDYLRSEETHRPVGQRILRIIRFPFGKPGENQVEQPSYVEPVQRRYGNHLGLRQPRRHRAASSSSASWEVRSILLMTTITGMPLVAIPSTIRCEVSSPRSTVSVT